MTLDLAGRTGLPDTLAPRRAAYPAVAWPAHANYGQLTAFWLSVHASLRAEAATVRDILAAFDDPVPHFAQNFVPAMNAFLGHLDAHHQIEDAHYFPRFRQIEPEAMAAFDLLEADHRLIHDRLTTTVDSARTLLAADDRGWHPARERHDADLAELARLLDRHLADEEEIVIPALLVHGERALG